MKKSINISFPEEKDQNLIRLASKRISQPMAVFMRSEAIEKARRILSDPELQELEEFKEQEEFFGGTK